jgi:predicted enzyme related to lactoylglutathione lyase
MQAPRIWYVNVFTSDLARAVGFYRDTLGFPLELQHAEFGYASFRPEGLRLGIAQVDADDPQARALVGRHTGIGLGVPDLDAAHRELAAKGVRFPSPPAKQPWGGYMAVLADPDGNLLYLDQLHPSER